MPEGWEMAAALLPDHLRSSRLLQEAEELRLRRGSAPTVLRAGREETLVPTPVTAELLQFVLDRASRGSLHAVQPELRRGYVTAPGGVRVGVCGTVTPSGVPDPEALSSLCVRVPRQVPGAGAEILPRLCGSSVLILSPPGGGKTTFLRELIRVSSQAGERIGLADERGEVAALWRGVPAFCLGPCTDVIADLPKAEAALMLLRSMGEEVIAMDEVADAADLEALRLLSGCGVRLFATAHAASLAELRQKPLLAPLIGDGLFDRAVIIEGRGPRHYRLEAL